MTIDCEELKGKTSAAGDVKITAGTDRSGEVGKGKQLAEEVLELARERLIFCLPYMNLAILHMPVELTESVISSKLSKEATASRTGSNLSESDSHNVKIGNEDLSSRKREFAACGTDGERIHWETTDVLRRYSAGEAHLNRAYLHMILHCVFLHPFAYERVNAEWWDLAADIAVEHVIRSLKLDEFALTRDAAQDILEHRVLGGLEAVTADAVYQEMQRKPDVRLALMEQRDLFRQDAHTIWGGRELQEGFRPSLYARPDKNRDREKQWRRIQANVKVLKQDESDGAGETAGKRTYLAGDISPAYQDYARLLRRFAVLTEEPKLDLDEFDLLYYTYGLQLYGKVPLVEPLETREIRQVKELVIAIDTSGSTQGNKVRKFLSQTCAILASARCFPDRFNLHLLQCDCEIQEDRKITSMEEFERTFEHFELKGGGGTSFVPVFTHVQELIREGEFLNLQGVILFTDGYGRFPEEDPGIPTAIVLYEGDCPEDSLPSWAEHVRLEEESKQEGFHK